MLNIQPQSSGVLISTEGRSTEVVIKTPSDFGCILSIQTSLPCYLYHIYINNIYSMQVYIINIQPKYEGILISTEALSVKVNIKLPEY